MAKASIRFGTTLVDGVRSTIVVPSIDRPRYVWIRDVDRSSRRLTVGWRSSSSAVCDRLLSLHDRAISWTARVRLSGPVDCCHVGHCAYWCSIRRRSPILRPPSDRCQSMNDDEQQRSCCQSQSLPVYSADDRWFAMHQSHHHVSSSASSLAPNVAAVLGTAQWNSCIGCCTV